MTSSSSPSGFVPYKPRNRAQMKVSKVVTQAMMAATWDMAFEDVGGVAGLVEWGQTERNKPKFFQLWSRHGSIPEEIALKMVGGDAQPVDHFLQLVSEVPLATRDLMSGLLAIRDTSPKSFRQMRVIDGVVRDGPAKRGQKPKPKTVKVAAAPSAKGKPPQKPARTLAQLRAVERQRKQAAEARARKEADRAKREREVQALVRRFLRGNSGLPEFCAREGLNAARFRKDLIAFRADQSGRAAA